MSRLLKPLVWALPVVMLLAGCNGTDQDAKQPEAPHTTYSKADWSALPEVTGADLQGGFASWRSACTRLKADANWGGICSEAAQLPASPSVAEISNFLQTHLDVYSLRSAQGSSDGLITGYYEPVYPGSLTANEVAKVPVYGVPSDLIVVNLDSLYPELRASVCAVALKAVSLNPPTRQPRSMPKA